MTQDELVLAIIRETIAQAPQEDREAVEAAATEIRAVLVKYPLHGELAIALLGAELAAK